MTTATDTTYNGWTNVFTWLVNVHDIVDEDTQRELVNQAYTDAYDESNDWLGEDRTNLLRSKAADALKEYVEELINDIGDEPTNLFVLDLYRHALGQVNWHELAGYMVDEYIDEIAAEHADD